MTWLEEKIREWEASDDVGWLRAQLEDIGEELDAATKTIADAAQQNNRLEAKADQQEKKISDLNFRLKDWHDSCQSAWKTPCEDEQHCTCVPLLRKKLDELEREYGRMREQMEWQEKLADGAAYELNALQKRHDAFVKDCGTTMTACPDCGHGMNSRDGCLHCRLTETTRQWEETIDKCRTLESQLAEAEKAREEAEERNRKLLVTISTGGQQTIEMLEAAEAREAVREGSLKDMIEKAHMAGQRNQGHCDPSYYEAMVYATEALSIPSPRAEAIQKVLEAANVWEALFESVPDEFLYPEASYLTEVTALIRAVRELKETEE